MLLIECPWCGCRAETEFSYGGEADIPRPADPDALSDAQWADYLFHRANPRGAHRELWNHALGCRRWFGVLRDTVSYEIAGSFRLDRPATESGIAGSEQSGDFGSAHPTVDDFGGSSDIQPAAGITRPNLGGGGNSERGG